jgi:hypothetical protein
MVPKAGRYSTKPCWWMARASAFTSPLPLPASSNCRGCCSTPSERSCAGYEFNLETMACQAAPSPECSSTAGSSCSSRARRRRSSSRALSRRALRAWISFPLPESALGGPAAARAAARLSDWMPPEDQFGRMIKIQQAENQIISNVSSAAASPPMSILEPLPRRYRRSFSSWGASFRSNR